LEQITNYRREDGKTFKKEETAALPEIANVQENGTPDGENVQPSEQSNQRKKNRGD